MQLSFRHDPLEPEQEPIVESLLTLLNLPGPHQDLAVVFDKLITADSMKKSLHDHEKAANARAQELGIIDELIDLLEDKGFLKNQRLSLILKKNQN